MNPQSREGSFGQDLQDSQDLHGLKTKDIQKLKQMNTYHVNPANPVQYGFWRGAQGLAEDVRYYGKWMRDEAEKRIGHLYPKVEITPEMAEERPDLKKYVGKELTVIAWLWARTVKSPNPAFAQVEVPLASTFMPLRASFPRESGPLGRDDNITVFLL